MREFVLTVVLTLIVLALSVEIAIILWRRYAAGVWQFASGLRRQVWREPRRVPLSASSKKNAPPAIAADGA